MYDNRLSNRFFLCAFVLLLSVFWLMPSSYASPSFMANSLEASGSYNGQSVSSAQVVAITAATGIAATAVIRVALADGTVAFVSKQLIMNATKAYSLLGLCAANPVACGVIGAGIAVTAGVIYLTTRNSTLVADAQALQKISAGVASASTPYNFPRFIWRADDIPGCQYYSWLEIVNYIPDKTKNWEAYDPSRSAPICKMLTNEHTVIDGITYEVWYVVGNAILHSSIKIAPNISPYFQADNFNVFSCLNGMCSKVFAQFILTLNFTPVPPEQLATVHPEHAPPLITTVPPQDWVIDPAQNIWPDIFQPVVIAPSDAVVPDSNQYPIPPAWPVKFETDPSGGVISTPMPVDPGQVTPPPAVVTPPVTIPTYPNIPYVPTAPSDTVPQPVSIDIPAIKTAIKDAVAEAQAEANENAIEDAENATPPDTNSFNIMNYLDYGDSWLPAECPNDLVFDIGGQNFVFSYSTVCEYAPSVRTFVLVSSLISFVGIVVGGLKL